jgi:hypothetical protein
MRTTVDIQDDILRQCRIRAAATGVTLGELVTDALRQLLQHDDAPPHELPVLPVARSSRPALGADLSPRGLAESLEDLDLARAGR